MEITKKTALITGGAQGLGKEIAANLFEQGYLTIIFDIQRFENIPDVYREAITDYFEIDLAHFGAANVLVDKVLKKYRKIDVLINNAATRMFKNFSEFDESEIERYINVNFRTPILLIKKVYPFMKKNGYGRIINISSVSAFSGYSLGSMYCSTKCALATFTESFAREVSTKNDVTINAICPDSFRTIAGEDLNGYDHIIRSINHEINNILTSSRNGEVLLILRKKTRLVKLVGEFKKRLRWLMRA